MEDKTTPTLNEKILQVLRANEDNITEKNTAIDDFKFTDVANAIEKLLLNEEIYLLINVSENMILDGTMAYKKLGDKIKELQTCLNNL